MTKSHLCIKQISPWKPYIKQKWTLTNCQANKFSRTAIPTHFNLLQVCPSLPSSLCAVFFYTFLFGAVILMLDSIWYILWHSSFNNAFQNYITSICNKSGVALSALTVPTSGSAESRQAAELWYQHCHWRCHQDTPIVAARQSTHQTHHECGLASLPTGEHPLQRPKS